MSDFVLHKAWYAIAAYMFVGNDSHSRATPRTRLEQPAESSWSAAHFHCLSLV